MSVETSTSKTWFTPQDDAQSALLAALSGARERLLVCMYALTLVPAVNLLISAHQAKLDVRLILDRSQAEPGRSSGAYGLVETQLGGSPEPAQIARLQSAGVPLVIGESARAGIVHSKYALIDASVWWGSYNWSLSAALQCNQLQRSAEPALVAGFFADFEANWRRLGGR